MGHPLERLERTTARTVAQGERVYAIGDIHGRADLFGELMRLIAADVDVHPGVITRLVVLGDIVDRGPQSAELVRRLKRYTEATDQVVVLKGNHEAMMVQALNGDVRALRRWLEFGGEQTLLSFGVDAALFTQGAAFDLIKAAKALVGADTLAWLAALPLSWRSGEVLFVHAGVRPGVALEAQAEEDLLWVREAFTTSTVDHEALIVHGHSIEEDGPVMRDNRIGVDTGAYQSGRLSAVCLEGGSIRAFTT